MSRNYRLAKVARQDIKDVWAYIHQDNPLAARDMVNKIYAAFDLLAENPNIGHTREDLTDKPLLFWTVRPLSGYLRPKKAAGLYCSCPSG
jgi:toxin ParE1/3/4